MLDTVRGRGSHNDFSENPFLFGCYTVPIPEWLTIFSKYLTQIIL